MPEGVPPATMPRRASFLCSSWWCERQKSPADLLAACRREAGNLAGYADLSLHTIGTCCHIGTVPASAIRRVAVIDPAKAPTLCKQAVENPVHVLYFALNGAMLRHTLAWMFGEAPRHFDGPPESERAGIRIIEPEAPMRSFSRFCLGGRAF